MILLVKFRIGELRPCWKWEPRCCCDWWRSPLWPAKGENLPAKRIIQVAQAAGVPIMQNVPRVRDLLEQGNLNEDIPADLIEPVAEDLRWARDFINED